MGALVGLFTVGYCKAKFVGVPAIRSGIEMIVLGGVTTAIGLVVGNILKVF